MPIIFNKPLPRRCALRGLGAMVSLPLLDAMVPTVLAAPSRFRPRPRSMAVQPRMICCYVPNGVNIMEWVPEKTGRDYPLSPSLKALTPFRDDFSVLSGLGHPASNGQHTGADTWLTGADLAAVPGSDYSNTISMDQVVAAHHGPHTRYPSLQLSDLSGTGSAGHSHTLSFSRAGTPLPAESSPQRLFDRLFVPDAAPDRTAALQRHAQERSILDSVLGEARALEGRLGKADRRKLDEYLTSVRETERRVARLKVWIDVPKPRPDRDGLALDSRAANAHDRPLWLSTMLEISYLAFVTDTSRVITFEWSREASGFGGAGENHHELSHHGGDPGMLRALGVIDRFHLGRLRHFFELLKATAEADRTMLDHTVILYGSGMNSGQGGEHSPKNIPTLLAGGKALGLHHGRHLAFDPEDHPPLANLLLTIMHCVGVEADAFQDSTGAMSELTAAG